MNWLKKVVPTRLKKYLKEKLLKPEVEEVFKELKAIPRYTTASIDFFEKKIIIADSSSFLFMYEEIFKRNIYAFCCSTDRPYIIDGGANIGLSVLYFKRLYPNAKVVAFEPDGKLFDILTNNVKSFELKNTELIRKALWNEETVLEFVSEGADGGRVASASDKHQIIKVPTESLRKYLNRKVDFLKIDIEGAETKVLEDCSDLLHYVDRLFVEYHSFVDREQELHRLLDILAEHGFRYNIQHVGVFSSNPFQNIHEYLGMDNQLNIFAVREKE